MDPTHHMLSKFQTLHISMPHQHSTRCSTKRPTPHDLPDLPVRKQARHSPFSFFALPREIRDSIYSHAFSTSTTKPHKSITRIIYFPTFKLIARSQLHRTSSLAPTMRTGMPSWTALNRQFLCEAIEAFTFDRVSEIQHLSLLNLICRSVPERDLAPQLRTLLNAIRTIKGPCTSTNHFFECHTATMGFRSNKEAALSSFLSLRGPENTIANLEWEWKYALVPNFRDNFTHRFESEVLSQMEERFQKSQS